MNESTLLPNRSEQVLDLFQLLVNWRKINGGGKDQFSKTEKPLFRERREGEIFLVSLLI